MGTVSIRGRRRSYSSAGSAARSRFLAGTSGCRETDISDLHLSVTKGKNGRPSRQIPPPDLEVERQISSRHAARQATYRGTANAMYSLVHSGYNDLCILEYISSRT